MGVENLWHWYSKSGGKQKLFSSKVFAHKYIHLYSSS